MAMPTPGGGMPGARARAENDVYTTLLIVAAAFAAFAIGVVMYRSVDLLGTPIPGLAG